MARRFYYVERQDTAVDKSRAQAMHAATKLYQYQHGLASEFDALYELLLKKRGKEKEEREEKKSGRTLGRDRAGQ